MIHSYPKVYALGHPAIDALLFDDVIVEEKIDGSQFSFGRFDGKLYMRSHNCDMTERYEKMFQLAVDAVNQLVLHDGWTYRCEYLSKPHHNTLRYSRVPLNNLILYDINTGVEAYLSHTEKLHEALRIGLEVVPLLYSGRIEGMDILNAFLMKESVLGNEKIEGVVIKNYARYSRDGKVMMGKYVSDAFKESHKREWRKNNPNRDDIVQSIIADHRTAARWRKTIQHLKESGQYEGSLTDIGKILHLLHQDIDDECAEEIKDALYKHFSKQIKRGISAGFPEWYKQQLAESQFERE